MVGLGVEGSGFKGLGGLEFGVQGLGSKVVKSATRQPCLRLRFRCRGNPQPLSNFIMGIACSDRDARPPLPLGIKTAQKPYIVWSLGPKALIYESLDS